ncbi:galactose oxidase [Trametes cingulata]|nr:galactose oxidase [Trametes cingulata]
MIKGRWSLISKSASLARSSHCVSVTQTGRLIVYGGELKPRTPVDTGSGQDVAPKGALHVFDLNTNNLSQKWLVLAPASTASFEAGSQDQSVPEPRVGATAVWYQDALYVWGGRGGKEMTPLDGAQVGIWKAAISSGEESHGASGSVQWERIAALNEDEAPAPRSYHTAVAHGNKLYIHAGCPATGRLGTLHAFSFKERKWETLASAPEPGRGGTCLVGASIPGPTDVLLRYGGFNGNELPNVAGSVDVYSVAEDKWYTVEPTSDPTHGSPGPRSVHGFSPFQSRSLALSDAVAILYHGERDASTLGHAGAGTFWDDAWVLTKASGDILSGWAWRKVEIDGDAPEGRGWFPPASWVDPDGNTRTVLFGGLLSSNSRSDELWELRID